jgi:TonB family protein
MRRRGLASLTYFCLIVALSGCTAIPVERLSAGTSMITSGGTTGKWQEIPMTAIEIKDNVYMVTYVRWDRVDQSAGSHSANWLWYRDGKVVHRCESSRIEFKQTPFRLWCRTPAAGLGAGHFRVELSVDGVPFATNEFDVVDVSSSERDASASYELKSDSKLNPSDSTAMPKGELLAHCPNAIEVAKAVGFPASAAEAGLKEGSVTLAIVLTPAGSLKNIRIVRSSDKSFNQAAVDAATRLQCSGAALTQDTEIRWDMAYKLK